MVKKPKTVNTPPVEQPTPTQPSTKNAEPLTATDTGKGSAEAAGPMTAASPAAPAQPLELTPETLAQIINQLSQNQNVMVTELKRLRDEVGSMRGGFSQARIDPAATAAPTQETPQIIQQLAPLALAAITKFLSGADEKPKSRISELVEAKIAGRVETMIEQALTNVSKLLDAEIEGRVMIADNKKVPEAK